MRKTNISCSTRSAARSGSVFLRGLQCDMLNLSWDGQ